MPKVVRRRLIYASSTSTTKLNAIPFCSRARSSGASGCSTCPLRVQCYARSPAVFGNSLSEIRQLPKSEYLPEKLPLLLRKLFPDLFEWRRKVERRQREVYWAEVSCAYVFVLAPRRVTVRQQIRRTASFEVFNRGGDVPVREMNQAVATQDHIRERKFVAS